MQLDVGQRFDRYQIVRQLGTGISGESYEAQDTLLQRTVTLKLIHPWSLLSDAIRRQFFREMQTMSLLDHPAVASILNYSDVGRQLYLAHKYAPFGSLLGAEGRTWFSPPLPLADALRYAAQLTKPLSYLHHNGFFHGALTPANILIQYDPTQPEDAKTPQFLLSDAGLAHFVRRYGHPIMTLLPVTAAPEQFYQRTTAASDQYALASLLYYWLVARFPFLGAPEEIRQQKLQTAPPLLSTLNTQVTSDLAQVIQRALSRSVEDRFPSLANFADALQRAYQSSVLERTTRTQSIPHTNGEQENDKRSVNLEATPTPQGEPETQQLFPTSPAETGEIQQLFFTSSEQTGAMSQLSFDLLPRILETQQLTPLPSSEKTVDSPSSTMPACPNFVITSPYTDAPYEVIINREEMTIGRAGSSDILLDYDPFTSRHHALLQKRDGRYVISDRRSAYGTTVNGHALINEQFWPLQEGDRISIGQYKLVFHVTMAQEVRDQASQNAQA